LVYQYGRANNNIQDAYVLVSAQHMISHDEGVLRGYDQIPRALQKKILLQETLPTEDQAVLRGLTEMELDLRKEPMERKGAYSDFAEGYDLLTTLKNPSNPTTVTSETKDNNATAQLATTKKQSYKTVLDLAVGTRIQVWWEDDDEYYAAEITECRGDFFYLAYDDGMEEWLPLAEHDYKLEEETEMPEPVMSSSSALTLKGSSSKYARKKILLDNDSDDDEFDDDEDGETGAFCWDNGDDDDDDRKPAAVVMKTEQKQSKSMFTGHAVSSRHRSNNNDKDDSDLVVDADATVSRYLQHDSSRVTSDGCIRPKLPLKMLKDGTYAAPKGRQPLGTYFDNKLGLFVPLKNKSAHVAPKSQKSDKVPFKKRKVIEDSITVAHA
jgi:hypothetical protein